MSILINFCSRSVRLLDSQTRGDLRKKLGLRSEAVTGIALALYVAAEILDYYRSWLARADHAHPRVNQSSPVSFQAKRNCRAKQIPDRISASHLSSHLPGDRFHQQTADRREHFCACAFQRLAGIEGGVFFGLQPG